MKNIEWIKCSDRLPSYKDIDENKSDTFWGYFVNQCGDTYIDLVGWNRSMNIFETGNDEIVLYWSKLIAPEPPEGLSVGLLKYE